MMDRQTLTAPQIERDCIKQLALRGAFFATQVVVLPREDAWIVARVILRDGSNAMSDHFPDWLTYGRPVIEDLQRTITLKN